MSDFPSGATATPSSSAGAKVICSGFPSGAPCPPPFPHCCRHRCVLPSTLTLRYIHRPSGDHAAAVQAPTGPTWTPAELPSIGATRQRCQACPGSSPRSAPDPLNENFCGFGTSNTCLAAIWNGTLTPLPTLGGTNGIAYAINNQGQVAGAAETTTKDPTCIAPQVFQFEAVLWGAAGQVQELPPLPGDTVGTANWSTTTGRWSAHRALAQAVEFPDFGGTHAVMWQNGVPADLGNLRGAMITLGASVNDSGAVVG
jgi:hypothetical protein